MLLGRGEWGLLGSMTGAGRAVRAFLNNQDGVRLAIQKAISAVVDAVDEGTFVDAAVRAIEDIGDLDGFGPALRHA